MAHQKSAITAKCGCALVTSGRPSGNLNGSWSPPSVAQNGRARSRQWRTYSRQQPAASALTWKIAVVLERSANQAFSENMVCHIFGLKAKGTNGKRAVGAGVRCGRGFKCHNRLALGVDRLSRRRHGFYAKQYIPIDGDSAATSLGVLGNRPARCHRARSRDEDHPICHVWPGYITKRFLGEQGPQKTTWRRDTDKSQILPERFRISRFGHKAVEMR